MADSIKITVKFMYISTVKFSRTVQVRETLLILAKYEATRGLSITIFTYDFDPF